MIRPGQHEPRRWLAEAGCRVLESAAAEAGMGCALAAAVTASEDAAGWVVALGDMPWLDPAAIRGGGGGARIALRPCCCGLPGPARPSGGFGRGWGGGLMALDGERGARDCCSAGPALIDWCRRFGAARRRPPGDLG